jgi:hypothetical protein
MTSANDYHVYTHILFLKITYCIADFRGYTCILDIIYISAMPNFVVAAPHSFCESNPERHCDRIASAAVREIKQYDTRGFIRAVHVSDKLRTSFHDYNRPNTNSSPWREGLRADIKAIAPDFVLEIHSFPGNHEMYQRLWPGADLAIFASKHNADFIKRLHSGIKSRVPDGYNIMIVKPWHPVSITDDIVAIRASQPGCAKVMHSLFEFNEDMPPERIPILARAVYDTVLELIEQNGVVGGGGSFDSASVHPASRDAQISYMANVNETYNKHQSYALIAIFLIALLMLIVAGRALIGLVNVTEMRQKIHDAWEYAKRNPL